MNSIAVDAGRLTFAAAKMSAEVIPGLLESIRKATSEQREYDKCPQAASHLLLLHPEASRSTNSGVFTVHLQPNMCEMSSLNLL